VVSQNGLGILNVLVPAPMRAVVPAATWYAATKVEKGVDTDIEVLGVKTLANKFCTKMEVWASPDYRDEINHVFAHGAVEMDITDCDIGYTGTAPAALMEKSMVVPDHEAVVMKIRFLELPRIDPEYECTTVSASGDYIVAAGSSRLVWTDRALSAHCPTDAIQHALDAVLVPGGVVAITARPSLVYVEEPTSSPVNFTETLLRNTDTADSEFRPTIRPVADFDPTSPEMPGGAPPGTMIALTPTGHIVSHAFDHYVSVHTIGEFEPTETVATAVSEIDTVFSSDDEDIEDSMVGEEDYPGGNMPMDDELSGSADVVTAMEEGDRSE